MMPCVHSGRLRASSVSSMRSTNVPPWLLGERPVAQGGAGAADVEEAGGRRREAVTRTQSMAGRPYGVTARVRPGRVTRGGRSSGQGQVAQLTQRHGERREVVVRRRGADLGEDGDRGARSTRSLVRRRTTSRRRPARQHVVGEVGERRQQVVAERAAGLGLPPVAARQRRRWRPTATSSVEPVEQLPVAPRRLSGSTPGRGRRARSRRTPCAATATHADRCGEIFGHARRQAARLSGERGVARCGPCRHVEPSSSARLGTGRGTRRRSRPMSSGGRRCRSSHSEHRSAMRRQLEEQLHLQSSTAAGRSPSISSHQAGQPSTSRATTQARARRSTDAAGLLGHAVVERDARQVDHLVDELRGDDLAPQPVAEDLVAEPVAQRRREVVDQVGAQVRVVGQVGLSAISVMLAVFV